MVMNAFLERVNEIHGDAYHRANGNREVAMSILAQRIAELDQHSAGMPTYYTQTAPAEMSLAAFSTANSPHP